MKTTSVRSLTFTNWAKKPTKLADAADIIRQETNRLDGYLNSAEISSKDIIINVVVLAKMISGDAALAGQFLDLAASRKITLPKPYDPLTTGGNGTNPMLWLCRVLVGEFDEAGRWVPSVYAAKNFPGAMRHLATFAEADVDGLRTVLENMTAKVGKSKVVRGIEAAKALDRDANGKPRKSAAKASISYGVSKLQPVLTFKADISMFPVNGDGFGVCVIQHLGDGKFGILMGADETLEVEEIVAASFESHRDKLPKAKDLKSVPMSKVSRPAMTSVN